MAGEELFNERASVKGKTYFFNIKQAANGSKYLMITESKKIQDGSYQRARVIVFEDAFADFCSGFKKAYEFMKARSPQS